MKTLVVKIVNNNKHSLDNNKNKVNIVILFFIFFFNHAAYDNLNLVRSGRCSNFNLGLLL